MMEGRKEEGRQEEDDGGRDNTALCAKHNTMHISPFNPTSDEVETQISIV